MDALSWIGLITWLVVSYYQFYPMSWSESETLWYTKRMGTWYVPGWAFGLIWFILYGLIGVSIFLFWQYDITIQYYDLVIILFLVNIVLNKIWSLLFFGFRAPWFALVDLILMFGTAVPVVVFMVLDAANGFTNYWPFALYLLYPIWIFVAGILNIYFAISNDKWNEMERNEPKGQLPNVAYQTPKGEWFVLTPEGQKTYIPAIPEREETEYRVPPASAAYPRGGYFTGRSNYVQQRYRAP